MSDPKPVADTQSFSKAVFNALGMDLSMVTSFSIHSEAGELPSISVTRVVPKSAVEPLGRVLEKYELTRKEAVSLAPVDVFVNLKTMVETTLNPQVSILRDLT